MATSAYGFTVPSADDQVDGPSQMLALADSIGPYINAVFASEAARDTAIPVPLAGQEVYTTDQRRKWVYDGTRWVASEPNKPVVQLVQTVAQTGWTSGTWTAVTFTGTDLLDRFGQHNPASNPSRIVLGSVPGWYMVGGIAGLLGSANATLIRAALALNGTRVAGTMHTMSPASTGSACSVTIPGFAIQIVNSGDYVELHAQQTLSSGTGGTSVSADYASSLFAYYLPGL